MKHKEKRLKIRLKDGKSQLIFGFRELPSGTQLELKIGKKWIWGTYKVDSDTGQPIFLAKDGQYELNVDSELRFTPLVKMVQFLVLGIFDELTRVPRIMFSQWIQRRKGK